MTETAITNHYFRDDAREALKRAQAELSSKDDKRLKYAALELRMAIEALTYDRAQAYVQELPPEEYATWQPSKVLAALLTIDPHANSDRIIHIGKEEEPGKPAAEMKLLGEDKPLKLAVIKKHYDALGNFLHVPTLKQIQTGKTPPEKIRQRCEELAAEIEKSLNATLFNATIGQHSECPCMRCEKPIRRRLRANYETLETACFSCGAQYTLTEDNGKTLWKAQVLYAPCPKCEKSLRLWKDKIKEGESTTCPHCETVVKIGLSLYFDEPETAGTDTPA